MKQLLKFQITRLKNKNVVILLPALLVAIGVLGVLLGLMFYGHDAPPKLWLVNVYNAYTQFSFLFLIYVFVSTFTNDFSGGIYASMKQMGFSLKNCILSKAIAIYVMTFIGANLFIVLTHFITGNTDYNFLFIILLSVNLSIVFILLFAVILAVTLKKTMTATIIGYASFLVMNVLNFVGYGLTNPADGNSISSVTIRILAGRTLDHYSLMNVDLDFEKYGFVLATLPTFIWVLVLLALATLLIKKAEKHTVQ